VIKSPEKNAWDTKEWHSHNMQSSNQVSRVLISGWLSKKILLVRLVGDEKSWSILEITCCFCFSSDLELFSPHITSPMRFLDSFEFSCLPFSFLFIMIHSSIRALG
jgi:hypothetical protein